MKKILLALTLSGVLLFAAPAILKAEDGNGHEAGYQCTQNSQNSDCPPPQQINSASEESDQTKNDDVASIILDLLISLLPKG